MRFAVGNGICVVTVDFFCVESEVKHRFGIKLMESHFRFNAEMRKLIIISLL